MIVPCLCEASIVVRCFPPAPEIGVAPKDNDLSEDVEENAEVVEHSDASEDEEDDGTPFIAKH
jgi:hypothetical protein